MRVSSVRPASFAVAVAGMASLFAAYWDDAWHTDTGRDSALIPPHLLLYGSVTVVGLVVAGWGLAELARTRSLVATLRRRPLVLAATGAVATLVAAPVEAFWHAAYGRDAVLWSPPHMLAIFASAALVTGVIAGLATGPARHALAAVLLGTLVLPVMEYDTDVPQFAGRWYLPVLLAGCLLAAYLADRLVPGRFAIAGMVAGYLLARIGITAGLAWAGRSTPDLPIAVAGLAVMDLPRLRAAPWPARYLAGAVGVSALAFLAAATGLSSLPPGDLGLVAGPVCAIAAVAGAATVLPRRRTAGAALLLAAAGLPLAGAGGRPAWAHDPGQGRQVLTARLNASSDGAGRVGLTVTAPGSGCAALVPDRIVARRAGTTRIAPLVRRNSPCALTGSLRVPATGRWFVYAELRRHGAEADTRLEGWLPVEADRRQSLDRNRPLYQPTNRAQATGQQVGWGAGIYLLGAALLGLAVHTAR